MAIKRVAWDSSVIIAFLQQEKDRYDVIKQHLARAQDGEFEIVASVFALCETARLDGLSDAEQERQIVSFFEANILPIQLDMTVAKRTREIIRTQSGIHGKDAVHIASALIANAQILYSYDNTHMLPLDGKINGLSIKEPPWKNNQPPLVDDTGNRL